MNNKELPIGFTMSLAMDEKAMESYTSLSPEQKTSIIEYVSQPGEGNEPKRRINSVIELLHNKTF